jgi:protocatechuate 3,4-dioxygenase beta subunit
MTSSASKPLSRRQALGALGLLSAAPLLSCADGSGATALDLSADATLSALTLSSGALTPAFTPATTSYAATVVNATAGISVTPTATRQGTTVIVNGTVVASGAASASIPLAVGSNAIAIVVTAANGVTTGAYTVTVTRANVVAGSCVLTPSETEGPYPLASVLSNPAMVRSDVRESKTGVPLTMIFSLINVNQSCAPITNAAIYVWQCDKDGQYSGYSSGANGNHAGETYLRGIQVTDANGQVSFTTIYPGWYAGRITHVHFQIYVNNNKNVAATATSQMAFPQAITQAVYASSLYAARGQNSSVSSFAQDNVFSDGTEFQLASITGDVTNGYVATLTIGVAV